MWADLKLRRLGWTRERSRRWPFLSPAERPIQADQTERRHMTCTSSTFAQTRRRCDARRLSHRTRGREDADPIIGQFRRERSSIKVGSTQANSESPPTSRRMSNDGLRSRGARCDDGAFWADDTVSSDTARTERSQVVTKGFKDPFHPHTYVTHLSEALAAAIRGWGWGLLIKALRLRRAEEREAGSSRPIHHGLAAHLKHL